MWKAFQRYRALDGESRALFWNAVKLFPTIAVSLRFRGFKRTKEALQARLPRTYSSPAARETDAARVQRTCRMVSAAAHYGVTHPTCLVQSLAFWYLLQKQNIPACLRIGVRKLSEKFEAHAWVEFAGTALNQAEEQHRHYAAFDSGFSDLPEDPR